MLTYEQKDLSIFFYLKVIYFLSGARTSISICVRTCKDKCITFSVESRVGFLLCIGLRCCFISFFFCGRKKHWCGCTKRLHNGVITPMGCSLTCVEDRVIEVIGPSFPRSPCAFECESTECTSFFYHHHFMTARYLCKVFLIF